MTDVDAVLDRVREHAFHPLIEKTFTGDRANEKTFTADRELGEEGIADLDDEDWRVRLLAIRDLVRAGTEAVPAISDGLFDDDVQVRYVCATALGALDAQPAIPDLAAVVREDDHALARSRATTSLGQLVAEDALELLRERAAEDPSRDVRHQAELAIDRTEKRAGVSPELAAAYRSLEEASFEQLAVGEPAPAFALPDTEGTERTLDGLGDGWRVLIWIFADWCPVCHREFDELIEMREAFAAAGVAVATIECSDAYRSRVMVGRELEPAYWFAEESFQETYTEQIWWPHLVDRAGAVGAIYGVDPLAFAVHAEYVNRPATVIVDPEGIVRFAYYGTFWGDRPSIEETLEMIDAESFEFEHPDRLER